MRNIKRICCLLFVFLMCTHTVFAATVTVNPGESIQAAIDAASYGDTINVTAGTYVENITLKNGVALIGEDPNTTIIEPNSVGFVVETVGCDPNTRLESFSVITPDLGMQNSVNSTPTVENCIFTCSEGMSNSNSSPMVDNCTFNVLGDLTSGMGNGNNSNPTVTNSMFIGNGSGSGMSNSNSNPIVTDCTFENFRAGIDNWSSSPTINGCTLTGNTGGGISNNNSNPNITGCTFTGNIAGSGGGIYNTSNSNPTISDCTFDGNIASADVGGGIYNDSGDLTIIDCVFTGNIANSRGGGVYIGEVGGSGSHMLTNCTFTGNESGSGIDSLIGAGMWCAGSTSLTLVDCVFNNNISHSISPYDSSGSLFVGAVETLTFIRTSFCGNIPGDVTIDMVNNVIGYYKAGDICYEEGDIDGDGDVDLLDFSMFAENWLVGT